jgi:SAM-dependent methyltransferase
MPHIQRKPTIPALFAAQIALCVLAAGANAALVDGFPPPHIGTPERVIERMLALAKVGPEDTVVDLGSGDGRIVIHAAKRLNARGIGVELMPDLVEMSRRNAERAGVADRVKFLAQNALVADLREASVLTLYLGPELNDKLMPRILQTMRPGARVVSHDFAISNWTPDAAERFDVPEKNHGRGGESSIYLWIVPANAAGRWQATLGEGARAEVIELSIGQQFQFIEGALHAGSRNIGLRAAKLSGDRISFELPDDAAMRRTTAVIDARIEGDRMLGSVSMGAAEAGRIPFVARRIHSRPDL